MMKKNSRAVRKPFPKASKGILGYGLNLTLAIVIAVLIITIILIIWGIHTKVIPDIDFIGAWQ